jgi:SAM-dependent methyltransferase
MISSRENLYNPDDLRIMIVSTPKTGNTWVKYLLANIYELPVVEVGPSFDAAEVDGLGPRWITHQHYGVQPDILDYGKRNDVVFVTTVRHPGDALLSKFHFVRSYVDQLTFADVDLSPLMARDGDTVGEHTVYYVRHGFHVSLDISLNWMRTGRSHVIRYEDLWRNPVPALQKLTAAICEVPLDRIQRSVELCDFDLMRTMPGADPKLFRKGQVGNWKQELPQEILDVFRHTEPYPSQFAELGYTLDPDDPLTTPPKKPWVSSNPFHDVSHFDNGVPVPTVVIRLYLSLDAALCKRWPAVERTGEGSFYSWLNSPIDDDLDQPGQVPVITNLAHYIYRQLPDLREAFPDVFEKDRIEYVLWFVRHAAAGYDLDQAFITPVQDALLVWGKMPAEEDSHRLRASPSLTNFALYVYHIRPNLQVAFPDVFGADRVGFADWFLATAQSEYASDRVLSELVQGSAQIIQKTLPRPRLARRAWRLKELAKRVLGYASRKSKKDDIIVDDPKDVANYQSRIDAQGESWGKHYLDRNRPWQAWLEHPLIAAHYQERMMVDGVWWVEYVRNLLDGPARRSLDLGCACGFRSLGLFKVGGAQHIEGIDISDDMIAEAEKLRQGLGAPGRFWKADVNACDLPPNTYDLIFSCHSFHHFLELEHVMRQVHNALTVEGLFLLEEFVGPTQFQWAEQQMDLVRAMLALLPAELRLLRSGVRKDEEPVLPPDVLDAASPFEAIRSADIVPLFERHFDVVVAQSLGGTIQHLLYNGIIHNFDPDDPRACRYIEAVFEVEDALIDAGLLPADFMLLIGKRKSG